MKTERVNEIDLLRFVAALMVVFYHYAFRGHAADGFSPMPYPLLAPLAVYGYLGVMLFFIISGFVILMTASRGSLRRFVVSRVVRLYPAFWFCCTATFVGILTLGAPRFTATFRQYLVNMTLLSELARVEPIDGVYWSLFVEIRFYVLVALLLMVRRIHQMQAFLVFWLLASVALVEHPVGKLGYVLITDWSAYFIGGAAMYLVWSQGMTWLRGGLIAGSWVLAVSQAVAQVPHLQQRYHMGVEAVPIAVIVTSFFAVMLLVALRWTGSFGRRQWLTVGALTYPLYLLHQVLGYQVFRHLYPRVNAHVLLWGTIAAMLALAWTVHVQVERRCAGPMKAVLNRWLDAVANLLSRRSSGGATLDA